MTPIEISDWSFEMNPCGITSALEFFTLNRDTHISFTFLNVIKIKEAVGGGM